MPNFDPRPALSALSRERPVFHSEADFQHALAWKIHECWPDARIRLEVPLRFEGRSSHLDLEVTLETRRSGVELKYLTAGLTTEVEGEAFDLSNQGAQDTGRYDVIKDICRLEQSIERGRLDEGWLIALTNDPSYWAPLRNPAVSYAQFALSEGRHLHGTLGWGPTAGPGTIRFRESDLSVSGNYLLTWTDYCLLPIPGAGTFRLLVVRITARH